MFKEFYVFEFPFLVESIHNRVNRMGIFMYDNEVAYPDYMTLTQLDILFKDDNTVYNYEGAYNTFIL